MEITTTLSKDQLRRTCRLKDLLGHTADAAVQFAKSMLVNQGVDGLISTLGEHRQWIAGKVGPADGYNTLLVEDV